MRAHKGRRNWRRWAHWVGVSLPARLKGFDWLALTRQAKRFQSVLGTGQYAGGGVFNLVPNAGNLDYLERRKRRRNDRRG